LEELYTLPPTAPTFEGFFLKGGEEEEEKNVEFLIPPLVHTTHALVLEERVGFFSFVRRFPPSIQT
jgi:hypothetical protein